MKKFSFKIKGREYDVEILDYDGTTANIDVNGSTYEVEVEGMAKPTSKTPTLVRQRVEYNPKEAAIKTTSGRGVQVKAPLPGNIFKINIEVGSVVKAGDTIIVMEAMKMENNIQSETSGTVKAIKVAVGDAVMQDDVLVELE